MTDESTSPRRLGGFDRAGRAWVLVLFGIGGIALGALLPVLAGWAGQLPWMPFQGPLQLIGSFDQAWLVWGRPLLGLLVGLALGLWVLADTPILVVSSEQIEVRRRGNVERVIERDKVAAIYAKGRKTVIETDTGRTLFEGEIEGDRAVLREAITEHGYPWEGSRD